MNYQSNKTYSGYTQDVEHLIRVAAELGAAEIDIQMRDVHVIVTWTDEGEILNAFGESA